MEAGEWRQGNGGRGMGVAAGEIRLEVAKEVHRAGSIWNLWLSEPVSWIHVVGLGLDGAVDQTRLGLV